MFVELAYFSITVSYRPSLRNFLRYPSKMATFALRSKKCDHQDSFKVIYTVKGGQTGRDLLNELHPDMRKTQTHTLSLIGHDTGATCATTSAAKGFEIDVDSTPLSDLKDLGIKSSFHIVIMRKDYGTDCNERKRNAEFEREKKDYKTDRYWLYDG